MSAGQWVGLVLILAMVTLCLYAAWEFYIAPIRDDWADLMATCDAILADFDHGYEDTRAEMRECLLDRIARDELAPFFEAWDDSTERRQS